jgi:hypothetical protein
MKQRTRVRKADAAVVTEDKTPTNRLTDISVNEVSIVDRAANQRKYLVVKDAPPVPPAAPHPPTAPPSPTLQISPELKAKVMGILTTAQERIGIIAKVLEGSSETPGAAPPQELMDALAQLAALFAPTQAPPAPPLPGPPAAPAVKDETKKAGRKLSAARLAQLQSAKTTLDALLADVTATGADESEPDADEPDEPSAPKTPAKKEEAPGKVEEPTAESAELTEIKAGLSGLVTAVGRMTEVFEGQNARIDALQKSRGESRQADLDQQTAVKKAARVVWDLDMARPLKTVQ